MARIVRPMTGCKQANVEERKPVTVALRLKRVRALMLTKLLLRRTKANNLNALEELWWKVKGNAKLEPTHKFYRIAKGDYLPSKDAVREINERLCNTGGWLTHPVFALLEGHVKMSQFAHLRLPSKLEQLLKPLIAGLGKYKCRRDNTWIVLRKKRDAATQLLTNFHAQYASFKRPLDRLLGALLHLHLTLEFGIDYNAALREVLRLSLPAVERSRVLCLVREELSSLMTPPAFLEEYFMPWST